MGDAKRRQELDPNWNKPKFASNSLATRKLLSGDPYPFLKSQGRCLVALARRGYEEKGRGILIMPGICRVENEVYIEMFYLTTQEVKRLPCLAEAGKADCLDVIDTYQPDREAAACFIFENEYEITRTGGFSPPHVLLDFKRLVPDFMEKETLVFHDDKGEVLVFTRGEPSNWGERFLP